MDKKKAGSIGRKQRTKRYALSEMMMADPYCNAPNGVKAFVEVMWLIVGALERYAEQYHW